MKILLTGITGLVGSAFVTDLLRERKDIKIVTIARGNNARTAQERVDEIIADQCAFDGHPEDAEQILAAIEVISGDVVTLDVDKLAESEELKGVDTVFHCAADVNLGKDPEGKTYRINYVGTQNMVNLAQKLAVKAFHYVGTAYIAGKLTGRAFEDKPIDSGFNNPYEESKYKAEMLVRNSGIPFSIYRPAIVVGRFSDGRIRKPLAFYRILEFMAKLKKHHCSKEKLNPAEWVSLNLCFDTPPSDLVYFVPIDYVQKTVTALFQKPICNKAYHITGRSPVRTNDINRAICEVVKIKGVTVERHPHDLNVDEKLLSRFLSDLLPYFSSAIEFDQTNIQEALGDMINGWDMTFDKLKMLMRAYLLCFFPKVDWLHDLLEIQPQDA